ncbi:MAG TPA: hypothetical protein VF255_09660 [Solirubrobacterales bacterium]
MAFLLIAASAAVALGGPSGDLAAGSEETVLRLHDLPPGYEVTDDVGCGPSFPFEERKERQDRLERSYLKWFARYRPEGCFFVYERLFEVPHAGPAPPMVEAETLSAPSEAAAAEGLKLYTALTDRASKGGERRSVAISPNEIQARLIRTGSPHIEGRGRQLRSFLFWRHGKVLSFLSAAGLDRRGNDRAVIHLAEIQQRRLEAPTPYTEAEQDDTEVRLDDPRLKFPVYWLGNPFQAGGSPVALEFVSVASEASAGRGSPAGQKFALEYRDENEDEIHVGGWTRRSWKRFQRSDLGKVNRTARCTRATEVELEGGSAAIYGAYDGKGLRPCPRRAPDRYYAIARIGRMVIGVNLGLCLSCAPGNSSGPYAYLEGMKAIVNALQVRPKPIYSQAD